MQKPLLLEGQRGLSCCEDGGQMMEKLEPVRFAVLLMEAMAW